LDDRLNPIAVKELRQAVQSKFVVGVLLLFLLVQVSIVGIYLVTASGGELVDPLVTQAGRQLFGIIQVILLATCMIIIPAYAGIRLAAERSDTNVDLLFITTLRPRAIISGKFFANLVLVLLIFSACTPFMTFTYLLRGIDVISMALVLALDFAASALAIPLALFLAVVPANRVFKILLGLVGIVGLGFTYAGVLSVAFVILDFGGGYLADSPGFWLTMAFIAVLAATLFGLFFVWAVALVSPASANRAWGMRIFLLVSWLAAGIISGWASLQIPEARNVPALIWAWSMVSLFSLGLMIGVSERDHWGPRVARTIPWPWWRRWPAFLFYSGAAGGVVFCVLMIVLTGLTLPLWDQVLLSVERGPLVPPNRLVDSQAGLWLMGLYTYVYALTAVLVRKASPWKIPTEYTWVVLLVLLAVGCVVPYLVSFLLFYREWWYKTWLLSNPFAGVVHALMPSSLMRSQRSHVLTFVTFAGAWAVVVTALNLPWFWRQLRGFRPYARPVPGMARGEVTLEMGPNQEATTVTGQPVVKK
jgi:hypothetical protein